MDYTKYEIEDFVSDEFFLQWVINGSAEATRFWEEYMSNNPAQRHTIEAARNFIVTLRKSEHTLHKPEKARQLWMNIADDISESRGSQRPSSFSIWKVAACIALLAMAILPWYVLELSPAATNIIKDHHASDGFLETFNNTGDVIRIHLSDGSIVDLHDKSTLKYRENYNGHGSRETHLTGEAFFEVAKNAKQPFFVYSYEVVTKVLGTSFRIKAYEGDEDILVAVKEGKVSVYSAREKEAIDSLVSEVNGVVLTPNQQVLYARSEEMFVKTLIERPRIIHGHERQSLFLFENTPAMEVFRVLESAYGVEIIVDEDVMSNCFLTVRLSDETLFEQLKIICRTIGARYELMDAKVIISGDGC